MVYTFCVLAIWVSVASISASCVVSGVKMVARSGRYRVGDTPNDTKAMKLVGGGALITSGLSTFFFLTQSAVVFFGMFFG